MSIAFGNPNSTLDFRFNVIFLILFKHEKVVTFTATACVVFPFITL
jgi:hypothetical protein